MPLRIIAERREILKDQGKPSISKGGDVFNQDERRPYFFNHSSKVFPETRASTDDSNAGCACEASRLV